MQNPRAMVVILRGMCSCLERLQPFPCICSHIHDGEQQSQWTVSDKLVNLDKNELELYVKYTVGPRFVSPQVALMYRLSIDQPFQVGMHTTSLLI